MPSPVGHLLGGAALYIATAPQYRSRATLAVATLGSIAPDFDFLPGILIGEPAAFHHGVSHSLAFAIFLGALVFISLHFYEQKRIARQAAFLGAVAYTLHIIFDAVSANNSVPLLWPVFSEKIGINVNLFGHFHHGGLEHGIWSVVHWDNLSPVIRELTILGIPVVVLLAWKERCRWTDVFQLSRKYK